MEARRVRQSVAKAVFDPTAAALILLILSPLMIGIALAIVADNGRPVVFRQLRSGVGGAKFRIYKFRTMCPDSEALGFVQASARDARTTRFGRYLRRLSLDELPQLFNVLKGEMSLVGPRPHPVELDAELARDAPLYWDRNLVKPGITGLAQVSGLRGPTDAPSKSRRRLALDRAYIRRWSFWLDLKLLALTPFRLFGPNAV